MTEPNKKNQCEIQTIGHKQIDLLKDKPTNMLTCIKWLRDRLIDTLTDVQTEINKI